MVIALLLLEVVVVLWLLCCCERIGVSMDAPCDVLLFRVVEDGKD
jgi:hypothetical protein